MVWTRAHASKLSTISVPDSFLVSRDFLLHPNIIFREKSLAVQIAAVARIAFARLRRHHRHAAAAAALEIVAHAHRHHDDEGGLRYFDDRRGGGGNGGGGGGGGGGSGGGSGGDGQNGPPRRKYRTQEVSSTGGHGFWITVGLAAWLSFLLHSTLKDVAQLALTRHPGNMKGETRETISGIQSFKRG